MTVLNTEHQSGIADKTTITRPEQRIPVRYDWDQSGFWIDYEIDTPGLSKKQHNNVMTSSKYAMAPTTSKKEFHREYGHLGSIEDCDIWVMDTVTWSHRDNDGSKYMVVQDEIRSRLQNPRILDCGEWRELENEFGFRTIAERACGVVEVTTKAILMQQNLPPQWWVRAAHQAVWLLNRFPSCRQIDRELSYFVPVGTPKTIWGIAVGMYREAVKFWVPTTNGTRQTKSFTAYKLRSRRRRGARRSPKISGSESWCNYLKLTRALLRHRGSHLESAHPVTQAPEKPRGDLRALEQNTDPANELRDTYVWIGTDPGVQKQWDELDQQRYLSSTTGSIVSGS
jgi:hypothetical protein